MDGQKSKRTSRVQTTQSGRSIKTDFTQFFILNTVFRIRRETKTVHFETFWTFRLQGFSLTYDGPLWTWPFTFVRVGISNYVWWSLKRTKYSLFSVKWSSNWISISDLEFNFSNFSWTWVIYSSEFFKNFRLFLVFFYLTLKKAKIRIEN